VSAKVAPVEAKAKATDQTNNLNPDTRFLLGNISFVCWTFIPIRAS
jgi:hypothetical protein